MRFILALLFLLALPAHAETSSKPQIYDQGGAPVDPLCFLSNFGTEDAPVYPTKNCEWEGLVSVGEEAPLPPEYVSTYYEDHFFDPETDETSVSRGFIGYRAIGQVEIDGGSYLAVVLIENGGGFGTFSSLMLLDMVYDEENEQRVFPLHKTLAYGDRCMGGIADARIDEENGDLIYEVNTTMADIFLLSGDPERDTLKSDAYKSLPTCAPCCYAVAAFSPKELRGVNFIPSRMKPEEGSDSKAATCVENMVKLNEDHGNHYFDAEDFGHFIRELEHVCLGRMEGE